jgi:hypothetical protein
MNMVPGDKVEGRPVRKSARSMIGWQCVDTVATRITTAAAAITALAAAITTLVRLLS